MGFSCRAEQQCAAPAEVAYDLLVNVERWPLWLRGVRSAVWEEPGDPETRQGAIRRIAVGGLTMREKILEADRPRHHAYSILSGIPVTGHRADVHIHQRPGGSLIVWEATFDSRIPLVGILIRMLLHASIARMAGALARGAEQQPK
jgi:hypothetical protein